MREIDQHFGALARVAKRSTEWNNNERLLEACSDEFVLQPKGMKI